MQLAHGHYFGEPVRQGSAGALTLIETHYHAALVTERHTHERSCLCIVIDGGFDEVYGRARRTCRAGTTIFRPAGEDHANDFGDGAHCLNIELSEPCMALLDGYAAPPATSIDLSHTPVGELAQRMYRELRIADDLSPLAMEGLALEMIVGLSRRLRENRLPPAWMASVIERLHETPAPSLAELGASAGVHPVHLARTFRKHHGCTIGAYVRRLRIEKASRLLSTTTLSLSQIAIEAGFSHQSHFTNAFRRATGRTPRAFRR